MRRLAWCLVLLSCAPSERPALPDAGCLYASDCATAQICSPVGRCVPECQADRDCLPGETCTGGACVLPSGKCLNSAQCATGQICNASGVCAKGCAASAECGAGSVCLGGACVAQAPECNVNADCGPGRVCTSKSTCAQSCTAASQCGNAQTCSAGICVAAAPDCATSADCAAPQVCQQGRCVAQCAADQDCGAGQRCQSGVCQLLPAQCTRNSDCTGTQACIAGTCASACVDTRDCASGTVCNVGVCVIPAPQCAIASDCGSGQACSPTGQCVQSCTGTPDCTAGGFCSNGACVANGPTTATINGSAVYSGQTSSAGITVTLRGPGNAAAVTNATGAFSFAGLPPGVYTLTFASPFSAEGSITRQAIARAGAVTTVPQVSFTPQGEVRGVVHLQGQTSALSVQVFVAGSSRGASTDATGAYDIGGVPPGSQQIVATYPGFTAASVTVTVAVGAVTTVPDLTLQPQVVVNGSVFAFASTPGLQVQVGHAYGYTAVAGGGGITSVTYTLAAGPAGMTIDAASGAVSFTPAFSGTFTVAIAADGGGAIVYQVFNLAVLSQLQNQVPASAAVKDGDTAAGVTWVVQTGTLHRFQSARTGFDTVTPQRSGRITSVSLVNGAAITSTTIAGGKVTALSAPAGTLAATWDGGRVGSVSFPGGFTVASARSESGTVSAVNVPGLDTATSIATGTQPIGSITASQLVPTSVTVPDPTSGCSVSCTGIATAVDATHLTDTSANFTFGASTHYLLDFANDFNFITGVTPTQLTVSGLDLTTMFGAGRRYFITNGSTTLNYTFAVPGDFTAANTSTRVDVYVSNVFVGTFFAAGGTNGSITVGGTPQNFAALNQATSGYILVAQPAGYHLVTLTDPGASFGSLAGQTVGTPGVSGSFVIDSNTSTSLVLRVPSGTDMTRVLARTSYVIGNAQGFPATVQLTNGGLTPSALKTKFVFNDAIGTGYAVDDNTASTVTLRIPPQDLGGPWTSARVVTGTSTATRSPSIVLTDSQGNLPSGLAGLTLARRLSNGNPDVRGTVSASDATTVTFAGNDCFPTNPCPNRVKAALADFAGATWATLQPFVQQPRVRITAQGTPGWAPDGLVGRGVVPESSLAASGIVAGNTATTLIATVNSFAFSDAFAALVAGQRVFLGDAPLSSGITSVTATVTDPNAAWSPGVFVGYTLIGADGVSLGEITANTAKTVTAQVKSTSMGDLAAGLAFAFGRPDSTGQCGFGQINASVTLAGATLTPGAYDGLTLSSQTLPVSSNDATSASIPLCPFRFPTLLSAIGTLSALSTAGAVPVTLIDSAASFVPGALSGWGLRPLSSVFANPVTISGNAAQSISFIMSSFQLSLLTTFAAGTSYVLSDPTGLVQLRVATSAALAPGSLAGRFVQLLSGPSLVTQAIEVISNDAGSVTAGLNTSELSLFQARTYQLLQVSGGVMVTLGDVNAAFTPGALAGQLVTIAGRNLPVLSNTAQQMVVAADGTFAVNLPAVGTQYTLPALLNGAARVRVQPDGTAAVALGGIQAGIAAAGAAGVTTLYTPFSTARQIQVTPRPALRGTYTSLSGQAPYFQIVDSTAPWTPGGLAGGTVSVRNGGSIATTATILSNTANTLTVYTGTTGLGVDTTRTYQIDPLRLDVAGGGLTPHAFAAAQLSVQGVTCLVRDNDAGSLLIHQCGAAGTPVAADPAGATAWLLTGLRGRRANAIANGAAGFTAATDDGLAVFDGNVWSHLGVRETSGVVVSGAGVTVDDVSTTGITCTACNFTPGALAGKQLWLTDGAHAITGNTAHTITANIATDKPPLLGDAFVVLDGRGLATEANDVAIDGSTTWVATAPGLLRGAGGAWSLLTTASTESSAGKADAIPPATLTVAAVRAPGELWISSSGAGVARLLSANWTQFTATGTESAPGRADGLPGDSVARITFEGPRVWFAGAGAASWDGASWAAVTVPLGAVSVVVVTPTTHWFGTSTGLFQFLP